MIESEMLKGKDRRLHNAAFHLFFSRIGFDIHVRTILEERNLYPLTGVAPFLLLDLHLLFEQKLTKSATHHSLLVLGGKGELFEALDYGFVWARQHFIRLETMVGLSTQYSHPFYAAYHRRNFLHHAKYGVEQLLHFELEEKTKRLEERGHNIRALARLNKHSLPDRFGSGDMMLETGLQYPHGNEIEAVKSLVNDFRYWRCYGVTPQGFTIVSKRKVPVHKYGGALKRVSMSIKATFCRLERAKSPLLNPESAKRLTQLLYAYTNR